MCNAKTWTRRLARGLIAGQLMLGAVSIGALATATPSHAATVLNPHGAWRGIAEIEDSAVAFGAMTEMRNGGAAAFVVKRGSLSLVLTNSDWTLKNRASIDVSVQIDGTTYSGHGVASDRQTIEIPDVSTEVLKMFVDGSQAEINVNDGDIVWTLDLTGFTAAIVEAQGIVEAQRLVRAHL
jgi:hypothetical protein